MQFVLCKQIARSLHHTLSKSNLKTHQNTFALWLSKSVHNQAYKKPKSPRSVAPDWQFISASISNPSKKYDLASGHLCLCFCHFLTFFFSFDNIQFEVDEGSGREKTKIWCRGKKNKTARNRKHAFLRTAKRSEATEAATSKLVQIVFAKTCTEARRAISKIIILSTYRNKGLWL